MLELEAVINFEGEDYVIKGKVNGPIDASNNGLKQKELKNYHEHALRDGSHAKGVAYVEIEDNVEVAYDVEKYDENEIRRIGKKAFETARARNKKLTCVDKANVLDNGYTTTDIYVGKGRVVGTNEKGDLIAKQI